MNNMLKNSFSEAFGFKSGGSGSVNLLKPETVRERDSYAITLNPNDSNQPRRTPVGFSDWWKDMNGMFSRWTSCDLELYCELSSRGRAHFHGVIEIKDLANFYYYDVPKMLLHFSVEIDTIKDMDVWQFYCRKQDCFMQNFIHREIMSELVSRPYGEYYKIITYNSDDEQSIF